jgi:hypothetical protein
VLGTGDDAQQRRLAAAVRAQQPDARARRELEVGARQDLAAAERLRDPAGGEQRDRRYEPASA